MYANNVWHYYTLPPRSCVNIYKILLKFKWHLSCVTFRQRARARLQLCSSLNIFIICAAAFCCVFVYIKHEYHNEAISYWHIISTLNIHITLVYMRIYYNNKNQMLWTDVSRLQIYWCPSYIHQGHQKCELEKLSHTV